MALYNESLRVHSTLDIQTDDGVRQIQLLFGDITALPKPHAVDVLLISSFPGDYTPTRTSLIGALQHSLGIKVRDLASSKEEDLRKQLHCWWSKPLPNDKPFRRIMCFEPLFGHQGRVIQHPAELVGEVFRCLIPLFNNEERTVLSPLLATGDANFSSSVMLRSMLKAAVSWIEAGLPMKRLGIVVYTRRPDDLYTPERELAEMFENFKTKYLKKRVQKQKVSTKFDIYVAYHEDDKDKVLELCKQMEKKKIQLYLKQQKVNTELEWQDDIHKTMLASRRVVAFLSPNFLCSLGCIEKFNIALVCGLSLKRDFLTPFLILDPPSLPTYIAMIQFVDCRTEVKQNRALPPFIDSIVIPTATPEHPLTQRYNLFISYAHADPDYAQMVLKGFADVNPLLTVFYDRNDLRAGSGWQKTLYSALDNSSIVIALLSPSYVQSQVCSEEYNIALANYLSDDKESELVVLQIKKMSTIPQEFSHVPSTDVSDNFQDVVESFCENVSDFLSNNASRSQYFHRPSKFNIYGALEQWREQRLNSNVKNGEIQMNQNDVSNLENSAGEDFTVEIQESEDGMQYKVVLSNPPSDDNINIAFIGGNFTLMFAMFRLLKYRAPSLKTNIHVTVHSKRLASIDHAKVVVAFLSPGMKDTELDELHVAIARHRSNKDRPVLHCIQTEQLPSTPTFLHLLPCHTATQDSKWRQVELAETPDVSQTTFDVLTHLKHNLPQDVRKVLSFAVDEIIETIGRDQYQGYTPRTIVNIGEIIRETRDIEMTNSKYLKTESEQKSGKMDNSNNNENTQIENNLVERSAMNPNNGALNSDNSALELENSAISSDDVTAKSDNDDEQSGESGIPRTQGKRRSQSCNLL